MHAFHIHDFDTSDAAADTLRSSWKHHFATSNVTMNQQQPTVDLPHQHFPSHGFSSSPAAQTPAFEGFSMGVKGESTKAKRKQRRRAPMPCTSNPVDIPSPSCASDFQQTTSNSTKNTTADDPMPRDAPPPPPVPHTFQPSPPPHPFTFSIPVSTPEPPPPAAIPTDPPSPSSSFQFHMGVPPPSSKGRTKRLDETRRRLRKVRSTASSFDHDDSKAFSDRDTGPLPFDIPLPPSPKEDKEKRGADEDLIHGFNHIHIVDPPPVAACDVKPAPCLAPSPEELDRRFCAEHTMHPPPISVNLTATRCWICSVEFVAAVDRVVYCVSCAIERNVCALNACMHPLATLRRVAKASSTAGRPPHVAKAFMAAGKPPQSQKSAAPPPPPLWFGLKKKGGQAYSDADFVLSIDLYSSALDDLDAQLLRAPHPDLRIEKAKVLSNRAAALMMVDKVKEALQDCEAAVDCDGTYLRGHLRLAKCHLLLGNTKGARASYRQVDAMLRGMDYRHHPQLQNYHAQWHEGHLATRSLESLMRQTKRHEDANDLNAALRTTEAAMAIALASRPLRVHKMTLLVALRAYDGAEEYCNGLVRNGALPGVHALGIEIAVLYVRALHYHDKTDEANNALQQLLKAAPTSVDVLGVKSLWGVMADLRTAANDAFKGGNYDSAVLLYTKALTLDTQHHTYNATILGNRAAAYMALKQHYKAIEDCTLALQHHPAYYKVLLRRARCYYTLKHYKESLADFDEYLTKAKLSIVETHEVTRERNQVKKDWDKAKRPPSYNYSHSWDDDDDFDTYSSYGGHRQSDNPRSDRSSRTHKAKSRHQQYGQSSSHRSQSYAKPPTVHHAPPPPTHYEILRVSATASQDDIKKSYRKLALVYHPDKAKSAADGELFKDMSAAYAVLSDAHLKAAYDKELRYGHYAY